MVCKMLKEGTIIKSILLKWRDPKLLYIPDYSVLSWHLKPRFTSAPPKFKRKKSMVETYLFFASLKCKINFYNTKFSYYYQWIAAAIRYFTTNISYRLLQKEAYLVYHGTMHEVTDYMEKIHMKNWSFNAFKLWS